MKRLLLFFRHIFFRYYNTIGCGNTYKGIGMFYRISHMIVSGSGNTIECYGKLGKDVRIRVYGNNHHLIIGKGVVFKSGCVWFEDDGCKISIDCNTTIEDANISVAESGSFIKIGKDCMFSGDIRISTTDSHSIIDLSTGERTNHAASIVIGDHVWLGQRLCINKGVNIGANSVVASNSVVIKNVPDNSVVGGIPAHLIKDNITWDRQRL